MYVPENYTYNKKDCNCFFVSFIGSIPKNNLLDAGLPEPVFCPAPTLKYVIFMGRQGYLNFD